MTTVNKLNEFYSQGKLSRDSYYSEILLRKKLHRNTITKKVRINQHKSR